ncbi:MAG: serine/threonine-protein kinase, partial [Planctomycetota bacterium]
MPDDKHSPRPGTPAEILAAYLTQTSREGAVDLEALCAEHTQHAPELRRLTAHWVQVVDVVDALSSSSSLQSRLEHRLGLGLDPHMSLDDGGSSATAERLSDEARRKLEVQAPLTRYDPRREITRGGMGAILEVWDGDLRRTLAMKVLLARKSSREGDESKDADQRLMARFLEEAQVTAQLDHPGILPVHELGIDDRGRIFFTMPLVKGQDLSQILKLVEQGTEGWTVTRAVGVLLKVCEAMAYAHSKRVIHRDLKPANVMVGRFGAVYVMDWGLAKVLGREDHRDLRIRRPDDSSRNDVSSDARAREGSPGSLRTGSDVVGSSDARAREGSPLVTMDGDIIGTPSYMS